MPISRSEQILLRNEAESSVYGTFRANRVARRDEADRDTSLE